MKIIIIGGGIGGLALAHHLRRHDVDVSVHERDRTPSSRWEGYRIHIDALGARALRECLPDAAWEAFRATGAREDGITFLTERLEELLDVRFPAPDVGESDQLGVDRAVLRRILLAGLDDVVHFGAEFTGYSEEPDGRVTAEFADGRHVTGDVLVGADGAGSRVRRQYLPDAGRQETGAVGIGHKIYLDGDAAIPAPMLCGMTLTTVDAPAMLFTAVFRPPEGTTRSLTALGVPDPPDTRAYVLAALVADRRAFPADPVELDDDALARAVDRLVAGWHPDLRRLLAASDPEARGVQVFRASTPTPPWTPSRVTVLGDAIHQMPPVGGMGGNTALRDAALLGRLLARLGDGDPVPAIAEYEAEMRAYAYPVVASALSMQRNNLAAGVLRTTAQRSFFRLCDRVPAVRRRAFGRSRAGSEPREWERAG